MSPTLSLVITGAGVWARGLHGFSALVSTQDIDPQALWVAPAPAAIPPKERRRAGTFINLAVEVAHQACELAGIDRSVIPSVFASAMGDTQITDYMCRKLTGSEKLLSPTQFHNSVHNAASGYWSISAGNRAPSSFVGGFDRSFGAGLLEAATQALSFATPVLLVCYDITTAAPLRDIRSIDEAAGIGLVLAPASSGVPAASSRVPADNVLARLDLTFRASAGEPLPAATRIPPALIAGAAQPEGLLLLDQLAVLASTQSGPRQLDIPMPRSGHLHLQLTGPGRIDA